MTGKKALLPILTVCLAFSCGLLAPEHVSRSPVRFGVFNVGQGLSQIVKVDTNAIVFDMGPQEESENWRSAFSRLGKTRMSVIVVSHFHKDHWGGLQALDTAAPWDGCIVTNPYVDTASLRDSVPLWNKRIRFKIIGAGDTLALPGLEEVRCLWPPAGGLPVDSSGDFANKTSLVFLIKTGVTSVLITSDIDSSVTRWLCLKETVGLKADLLVVPHHGSNGSLDPVFYGYVRPAFSIISYGKYNSYGHPSATVLLWLAQTGTTVLETALDGDCFFESNGYYWQVSE